MHVLRRTFAAVFVMRAGMSWPWALCLAALGFGSARADERADAVVARLTQQRDAVSSLMVKYRYSSRLTGSPEDARRYLRILYLSDEIQVYAIKGDKRYLRVERTDSLADVTTTLPSILSDEEPTTAFANQIFAFDGTTLRKRESGGTTAGYLNTKSQCHDSSALPAHYLGLCYKTPPDVLMDRPDNANVRLLEGLASGTCRILPDTQAVDGADCLVIEWDGKMKRRIWCDPALGYAVRKFTLCQPDSDLLMWSTVIGDFFPERDGISWPRKATASWYPGPKAPEELHNAPLMAYDYEVLELNVNDVPDDLFELKFPEDVRLVDFRDSTPDPETGALRGKVIRRSSAAGDIAEHPAPMRVPEAKSHGERYWILGACILSVGLLTYILFRRSSRPRI